ncbi:hypothetical protein OXT66_00850 [Lentilactobacillus senioris]|uniref:hypothetical protein n=1 Tax=Lentilactobacillus senioris TaxID=931534 RepID=UPI00228026C8|nr:hypothetical protein [Lentilactobacillus senioris]MCY9806093.1 hypothetical protein [Lentilactobacillus senioris]
MNFGKDYSNANTGTNISANRYKDLPYVYKKWKITEVIDNQQFVILKYIDAGNNAGESLLPLSYDNYQLKAIRSAIVGQAGGQLTNVDYEFLKNKLWLVTCKPLISKSGIRYENVIDLVPLNDETFEVEIGHNDDVVEEDETKK